MKYLKSILKDTTKSFLKNLLGGFLSFLKLIIILIGMGAIDHSSASIFAYQAIYSKTDFNGRDALISIGYLFILIIFMFGFVNGWDEKSIINFIKRKETLKSETKISILFLVIFLIMCLNYFLN
jgi:hypothetical protein